MFARSVRRVTNRWGLVSEIDGYVQLFANQNGLPVSGISYKKQDTLYPTRSRILNIGAVKFTRRRLLRNDAKAQLVDMYVYLLGEIVAESFK